MTIEQQLSPAAIVGEQVSGEAAKARKQLESLIAQTNKSAFDIGRLAHQIRSKGYYTGYTTFNDYAKSLAIKLRKLQYLRRIAEVEDILSIPHDKTEKLGIAKMREITSLNLEDKWTNKETGDQIPMQSFVQGLVDKAVEMDIDEVKSTVRELKGLTGENDIVWHNVPFTRSTSENVIKPAIQLALMQLGSAKKDDEGVSQDASEARAWEMMATEYMNDPVNHIVDPATATPEDMYEG